MVLSRRSRRRFKTLSAVLGIAGVALWAAAAAACLTPIHPTDVSIVHLRVCELGVVLGGAFVVGAIALFAGSV